MKRKAGLILLGVLLPCLAMVWLIRVDCNRRNTIVPQAPHYPGAVLDHWLEEETPTGHIVRYFYQTGAAADEVALFYAKAGNGDCFEHHGAVACTGRANPYFGEYTFITNNLFGKPPDSLSAYMVEVRWNDCR
jgi:hypothetical protein